MTMARKIYPYSLDRHDKKVAGVCSSLGAIAGTDPTFVRIGFVAAAIFISFQWTLIAYAAIGICLAVQKKTAKRDGRVTDFERMDFGSSRRGPSVHQMRTELDPTDRRLMAIDHHIHSQNEELAREIEALRQEEK